MTTIDFVKPYYLTTGRMLAQYFYEEKNKSFVELVVLSQHEN